MHARPLRRASSASPIAPMRRVGACLLALLLLIAGNLHTCELGMRACCKPQKAGAQLCHAQSPHGAQSSHGAAPTGNAGPVCCRRLTVEAHLDGRSESCKGGFCLAKMLQNTPTQIAASFGFAPQSVRLRPAQVAACSHPLLVAARAFDGRGPPLPKTDSSL